LEESAGLMLARGS